MMVVGKGEADRWLKRVLDQRKELVDDMVIVGNNTDKKTEKLINKYGFWFYRDDREWGIYQPDIKQDLLNKVIKLKPDYILPSDADEIYDKRLTKQAIYDLFKAPAIAYYFHIINLWNDEDHYRHDASFYNIRLFRYRSDLPNTFERKRVHCGLAPSIYYNYGWHCKYLLLHYGLMKPEDRRKKAERYAKYDPRAVFKGREYYDKLTDDQPPQPFNEERMCRLAEEDMSKYNEYKKQPRINR